MSAKVVSFPSSIPFDEQPTSTKARSNLPKRPPRKSEKQRSEERESRRKQDLQRRWAELGQPLALDPTYRAWHSRIDQLSVDMDLPYMDIKDIREMFLRMFKNGAMSLSY